MKSLADMKDKELVALAREIVRKLPGYLRTEIFPKDICNRCGNEMAKSGSHGYTYYRCWGCYESYPDS